MDDAQPPATAGRRRRAPKVADPHADMGTLIAALTRQAEVLEQIIPLVPDLKNMVSAWKAGNTAVRTIGRSAIWAGVAARWSSSLVMAIALLWAIWTHKLETVWEAVLGIHQQVVGDHHG